MGHHDDQSQQHGMGQSGLEGSEKERDMQGGAPSGGMDQGTSQVGTHGNEGYDQTSGGYGQGSGFDQTSGTGAGRESDLGTTSTGGGQLGDMTQEPYTQDDPTRSGNTGWNDRSESERQDDRGV